MAILELRDLSKFYNTSGTVALGLRHINLSLSAGEFVAITGESGSGKTTLLNVLSGLDGYDEGELFICGKETSYCSERERETYRNNLISYIFQDYSIIDSYTVYQNVELALLNSIRDKKDRHAKVMEILRRVGLESHAKHRGTKLSGGQKQRVSIARALAKDAPILFGDEPTGNLDSKTGKEIMELLNSLSKDKLVVIVTHNYEDLQEYATRRIRLFDGEIIEDKRLDEGELPPAVQERFETIEKLNAENAEQKIIDQYSEKVAFFADAKSAAEQAEPVNKKEERRRRFKEAGYSFKTMLHIGGNNLKATPKRTFFSFTGMVLLALASIYACYSFFSASFEEPTRQNNYTGTYESRELVAVSSPNGYITQSDIDAIMSDKRAVCVLNDTTLSYYLNYVDLSAYLEYKKSGLISYDDTSAVDMTLNCSHILSKVDEGRLPEHSGEIALIIQSNPTKNDLLGKTLTFYDYSYYPDAESYNSATNFYGTLPTHSFVVTGIKYAESFAAYIVHDDFVAISTDYYGWHYENPDTTSHVEANGKENLSYVYVRFYPDKTNVNSLMSALKAKGFKCYYPYGLQSHTLTLQLLVALLYIAGITILLLIVLVVTSGAQRSVSDLKRREYGIMRTVGIKGSMLSKMYLTEQWILAFFAHIAGGVIFTAIQIGTLFWGRQSGVIITLLLLKTTFTPILKSFIVGFFLTMIFAAIIVGRFNKKFYNNTVKTALTETEALV